MGKLFGTDGVRGVVGESLDALLAYRIGQAASLTLTEAFHHKARFCIGKDTRISSDLLEAALVAGVTSTGADVMLLGVVPTPAVALLTMRHADAGIMISASHNPFEHNGIKIFDSQGFKLSDELENEMEALILAEGKLPHKTGEHIGRVTREPLYVQEYIDHIAATVDADFSGLRVAVDCANGSASSVARPTFERIGLNADIGSDHPNGININDHCGSTHLGTLGKRVVDGHFDLGIAFDGDADRCLIVDEKGQPFDGDQIMSVCALEQRRRGQLPYDTIVATVMSNLGFHTYAREHDLKVVTASVGDRYVLEEMQKGGYLLGGEQSGHLIFLRHATTGDGLLTALQFLDIVAKRKTPVSQLLQDFKHYPQTLKNITIRPDARSGLLQHPQLVEEIRRWEDELSDMGRVLVRLSGTEPLLRIMVEGPEEEIVHTVADAIGDVVHSIAT